jgi:Fe2+ or Zn2+ uptake regulation protein
MSKPKGKISVREAVERIYYGLPLRFSMISLHAMVAREINRPYVFLDTVRRKLFELREEGIINFKNVDKAKSIYHKTERL